MKSTAIEVQRLKKVFKVFPYKFTRNDGEFVSYLDESYLKSSVSNIVENELDTLIATETDEKIVFKVHDKHKFSAVILLEKYKDKVYGEDFIDSKNGRYTYICLEIVNKSVLDISTQVLCKYVIPTTRTDVDSLLGVLDLNLDKCRLVSGTSINTLE